MEAACSDVRRRWEQSDYDADNPIHRMRGQALVWLFTMRRRCHWSATPVRSYLMPAGLTLAALLVALILAPYIHLTGLLILVAAVLISVRAAGLRAGLMSTATGLLLAFLVLHGAVRHHGGELAAALLVFSVVSVLGCILIDTLETARQEADRERAEAEATAKRYRFLAEATAVLDAEFTAEAMLSAVSRVIVPTFATWAMADLFQGNDLRRVTVTHENDALTHLLRSVQRDRSLFLPAGHPLYNALLAREAKIFANVTVAFFEPLGFGSDELPALKPAHLLFVPLMARNRLLGALSFVSGRPDESFTQADLAAARDLALRLGLALDNLRLYHGALDEAAELAQREREAADLKSALEQERTALQEQNARLTVEAATDGLTGLLNHITFQRALEEQTQSARRDGTPLSVSLLDVDHFKQYNDAYGHPAGDEVLRRIAAVLRESSRASDIVARYGGEEFVIVMPHTSAAQALEAVERIRRAIEKADWPNRPVTASFGIATFPGAALTPRELVGAADGALYRSKQAGRNCVTPAQLTFEAVVADRLPRPREGIAR